MVCVNLKEMGKGKIGHVSEIGTRREAAGGWAVPAGKALTGGR